MMVNLMNNGRGKNTATKVRFLICQSCFWCASCINAKVTVSKCPVCQSRKIEYLPIADDEFYKLQLAPIRNVTLSFDSTTGKNVDYNYEYYVEAV